jgi:RimJ/RimL family protein N-acetyltransferase
MYVLTQRLLLRDYRLDDEAALRELDADPEVQRERGGTTITEQQTRDRLQEMLASSLEVPRDRYDLAICLPREGRLIGGVLLHFTRPELREAEIRCVISRPERGQGYATEAARALLRHGFEGLGLHRIVAHCRVENGATMRVMEKLKMRREAEWTEAGPAGETSHDRCRYAIHAREARAK